MSINIDDNKKVTLKNRTNSVIVYSIPDMGDLRREFQKQEEKIVTFEEIRKLSYTPGGMELLTDYLVLTDKEVIKQLGLKLEPEYFYSKEEVIELLKSGSLDEFLDCLDFAPKGVLDLIKQYAVTLPLNDVAKRKAILDKLNFDITKAIQLQQEEINQTNATKAPQRRAGASLKTEESKPEVEQKPARRVYKKVEKDD